MARQQSTVSGAAKIDEEHTMAVKIVPKEEMLDAIGTKFEPGEWIEVTQDRINVFADCTEDHQFIHVDPEAAKAKLRYGRRHLHLLLSLYQIRVSAGRHVLHEHPNSALRWKDPVMLELLAHRITTLYSQLHR
jgi:acyl dehydratase